MERENQALPRLKADDSRVDVQMREALRGLRFGRLTIVVQDGIIVQVERTEKVRLPPASG